MFGLRIKKEYENIYDTAVENYKSYPKRLYKRLISGLDRKIKEGSYNGDAGTYLDIDSKNISCVDEIKNHYEEKGFTVEVTKSVLWIWWGK